MEIMGKSWEITVVVPIISSFVHGGNTSLDGVRFLRWKMSTLLLVELCGCDVKITLTQHADQMTVFFSRRGTKVCGSTQKKSYANKVTEVVNLRIPPENQSICVSKMSPEKKMGILSYEKIIFPNDIPINIQPP